MMNKFFSLSLVFAFSAATCLCTEANVKKEVTAKPAVAAQEVAVATEEKKEVATAPAETAVAAQEAEVAQQ